MQVVFQAMPSLLAVAVVDGILITLVVELETILVEQVEVVLQGHSQAVVVVVKMVLMVVKVLLAQFIFIIKI
jgi:hypothetical protein